MGQVCLGDWDFGGSFVFVHLCMVFKFQFELKAAVANTSSNG